MLRDVHNPDELVATHRLRETVPMLARGDQVAIRFELGQIGCLILVRFPPERREFDAVGTGVIRQFFEIQ
jgi:hypothetical protein